MPLSYANPTSGPSAGGIGWVNFENLTLNPNTTINNLGGTLNDGTVVTFSMTLTTLSGQTRSFVAETTPTFPGAEFGVSGYTGIVGNVALNSVLQALPGVSLITINNIIVKDALGNVIPEYTVILADAERTNTGEQWQWNTNGGTWKQLAQLGGNPPTLTGLNTQTAVISGSSLIASASYVLYTQTPSQLSLTLTNPIASRQAFAIGFAITRVRTQKDVGQRIDPTDQFVLDIGGTPFDQATTIGTNDGIQAEVADIYAIPLNTYTINESMAPGSASVLGDYKQFVSALNATPAGSVPPTGNLPISFTPSLGDDVTYTILNAAPETFTKSVDKGYANIGDILTYTITVNNPNDFAVNNVLVTDLTPTGTTYIGNLTVSTAYTGTDLATGITLTTVGADETVTITWQVQVNMLPPVSNPVPNYANVTVPNGTSGMTNVVMTQVNTAYVTMNKMVDKVFAKTGDILTYTIALNNAGNVPANNVVISDVIPIGTTYVPGSVINATGTPPTFSLIGSIPAGGNVTMSFQVLVGDAIPSTNPITNSASSSYTFTVNPNQPNGANGTANSNTVSTQINEAILTTTKNTDLDYANINDTLTYTIAIKNDGNVAAENIVITDMIPSGTSYIAGSLIGGTGTPPTITITNPVAAGATANVSFQVKVNGALPTPNPILNSATTAFTFTMDPEEPNGETGISASNVVSTKVNHADVSILKTVNKNYADTGDILTYTLQLQNTGNVTANNVIINDLIPVGTTFVLGSLTGATGTPPTFALNAPLTAGGNANVTFQVKVNNSIPQPNPLINEASVTFTYTVDPANPDGASGSANSNSTSTQVNHAQLQATKSVDKDYADLNDILTYTIVIQNIGNVVARNVTLSDLIPVGTTFVPGSLTGATGTFPNITLSNPIGAGASATITFKVKVTSIPVLNPINNIVSVNYKYSVDPAFPNGASAVTTSNEATTQLNHANLTLVKNADKFISFLGDTITYQLALTNTGNAPADQVVITDAIVNGTNYVNGSLTVSVPFSGTPQTSIILTNPVAPGEVVSISFKAIVSEMPLPNPIVNIADVAYVYTVDPAEPDGVTASATSNPFRTIIFRNNYQQQINDLIETVALQQAALAAISNAEGAKIQKAVSLSGASNQELLCINRSVEDMLASITILEAILKQKMGVVNCQIDGTC